MALIVQDTFVGPAISLLADHVSDSGHAWIKIATPWTGDLTGDNYLRGDGYMRGYPPHVLQVPDVEMPSNEYDIEFDLLYTGGSSSAKLLFRVNATTGESYLVEIAPTAVIIRLAVDSGSGVATSTLGSVLADLVPDTTYHFLIEVRNSAKKVYRDGVEIVSVSNNALIPGGYVGFELGLSTETIGAYVTNFEINTVAVALEAPTVAVIDNDLTGWVSSTGEASSVAPTAAGVYCPEPTTGTPDWSYQWHLSTTAAFTPSGGTAVSGATNRIQLLTGLTPSTTYYAKCVVADAIAATVTTNEVSFTTLAAYPAGVAIIVHIGDSTSDMTGDGMRVEINTLRGRSDSVNLCCSQGGATSTLYLPENPNNWLKFSVVIAKAHGATALNNMLGVNGLDTASYDLIKTYVVSQGLTYIPHYVLYRGDDPDWIGINAAIATYNGYIEASGNGTTIKIGDRQCQNYFSNHPELMSGDHIHATPTGYQMLGKMRGRALAWRMGWVTPTLSIEPSTVESGAEDVVLTVTGTNVVWNDGTPGHPTLTVSAGSISAQTLPDIDGDASLTIDAPESGSVTVTDPDSGATGSYSIADLDTTPPSVPADLTALSGDTLVYLTWSASTGTPSGYKLYRNGSQVYDGATRAYLDTGRTNGTELSYTVAAYDAAPNLSAQSSAVLVTPGIPGTGGTVPSEPDQTVASTVTRNGQGEAVGNTTIYFRLIDPAGTTGSFDRVNFSATSDENGSLQVALLKNSDYEVKAYRGRWVAFSTTDADTFELPETLSGYGS